MFCCTWTLRHLTQISEAAFINPHMAEKYSLLLLVRLAHLCIQLRFSLHLILGEEEDMFCFILHAPQVGFLTFLLPSLKMWDRYVSILRISWLTVMRAG